MHQLIDLIRKNVDQIQVTFNVTFNEDDFDQFSLLIKFEKVLTDLASRFVRRPEQIFAHFFTFRPFVCVSE